MESGLNPFLIGHVALVQPIPERGVTQQKIPSQYQGQIEWLAALREVRWSVLPEYGTLSDRPRFLLVHLFSGRRRERDFHWYIESWAAKRNVKDTILSMDTANSITYGSASWMELVKCYQGVKEAGFQPPWLAHHARPSAKARHQQAVPQEGAPDADQRRWPRPLRSFARLVGVDGRPHSPRS